MLYRLLPQNQGVYVCVCARAHARERESAHAREREMGGGRGRRKGGGEGQHTLSHTHVQLTLGLVSLMACFTSGSKPNDMLYLSHLMTCFTSATRPPHLSEKEEDQESVERERGQRPEQSVQNSRVPPPMSALVPTSCIQHTATTKWQGEDVD
jgi:hypothetical protein